MNKAIILGNLGADPELRYTQNGKAVANFRVATNESWTDKDGKKQDRTEWHRVVVWEKLAELCGEYLAKGRQVLVEGKIQTRKWQDKDGKDQYTTEILAQSVKFIGGKNEKSEVRVDAGGPPAMSDDDVPF